MTYHVILLVMISNNISLSLLIVLIYHLIPNGLLIRYTSLLSYYDFNSYSPISCLLRLNFFSFRLPHKVLQLIKAYKAKPA